ncbi:MAG: hypothetical protein KF712_15810 [Akkermansiaceae bacterium]|nr:hypothetical protein [Akkermansiaceae bacterium]
MNPLDHLLLAPAAILTVVSGIFLIRESIARKAPSSSICILKSRTLGALAFVASLLVIGFVCSYLWTESGVPSAIAVFFFYAAAMAYGHRLIRNQFLWQCLINATVGAWLVWFVCRDGHVSGKDAFLLGGLGTWVVSSLIVVLKKPSIPPALSEITGGTGPRGQ